MGEKIVITAPNGNTREIPKERAEKMLEQMEKTLADFDKNIAQRKEMLGKRIAMFKTALGK